MPRTRRVPRGTFVDLGAFDVPDVAVGRRVRAYLPHNHDHSRPRPVLVLFDGQNVFGDEGSFSGGWHAHEVLDRFVVLKRPVAPVILAIDHGHVARLDELTPWSDGKNGGKLDPFLAWIGGALLPLARNTLGLRHDPSETIVGGSSLGGFAALYAHFARPDVFGGCLVMSPSLWFAGGRIFPFVASRPRPLSSRIYLDCGVKEARGMMFGHSERMARELAGRGYGEDSFLWRPDAKGTHSERHWRRRLPKALRFMFR